MRNDNHHILHTYIHYIYMYNIIYNHNIIISYIIHIKKRDVINKKDGGGLEWEKYIGM